MARGIKPEKVAGIVALSYLVLIPVGGLLLYRKVQIINQDLTAIWDMQPPGNRPTHEASPLINFGELRRFFGG